MAMVPQGEYVPPEAIYRFAGVEADAAARRLYIDGKERSCSHRVFNLLLALCEEPGRVHTRDELFARLWPDGRFPADESLSQLIFRLRTALGPYNSALVTVRHVGVRLDAEVRREVRAVAAVDAPAMDDGQHSDRVGAQLPELGPEVPPRISPDHPATVRPLHRPLARSLLLGATALLVAAGAATLMLWRWNPTVDVGWGLRENDLMASRADTAATVQEALRLNTLGDRSKAQLLLETVHQADLTTPVPSMFLGVWANVAGQFDAGKKWFALSEQRLGASAPHYTRLLDRHLREGNDSIDAAIPKLESLLLSLRPKAWQIRIARAHRYLMRNQRSEALADLVLIPVTSLDDRHAAVTLGDRASLGDPDGAEAVLSKFAAAPGSTVYPYVMGRIQFARGDYSEARSSFDQAAAIASHAELPWLRLTSELHAATISAELGDWSDARERLQRLRIAARDEGRSDRELGASLLLLALPINSPEERAREFENLANDYQDRDPYICVCIELVLGMLNLETPEKQRCALDVLPDDFGKRGQRPLLRGFRALVDGDSVAARAELERARAEGIQQSLLATFADALAASLGETVAVPPPPDPPYPFWERYVARWQLQAAAAKYASAQ